MRPAATGFTLIELVVALAVLSVALLGLAEVLGAAADQAARAAQASHALDALDAQVVMLGSGASSLPIWPADATASALPATGSGAQPTASPDALPCQARRQSIPGQLLRWEWIEVACGRGRWVGRLVAR